MYLQEILEVAIGLVFMWLVLSIAVMQLQEWLANIFNWRAKDLERTIREMLGDRKLAKNLYAHPLIASLYRQLKLTRQNLRLPSYIPSDKFAMALFDLVMTAGTDASPINKLFTNIHSEIEKLENPEQRILAKEDWQAILVTVDQLAHTPLSEASIDSLRVQIQAYAEKHPELQAAVDLSMPQISAYYQALLNEQRSAGTVADNETLQLRQIRLGLLAMEASNPELKQILSTLLQNAELHIKQGETVLASARTSVESWFNDVMDRLSGAYKRKAQLIAFIIGTVLAFLFNVDSINVSTNLWREPTLRQAIVAQAGEFVATSPETGTQNRGEGLNIGETVRDLKIQLQVLTIPFGWTTEAFDTNGKQCAYIATNAQQVTGIPSLDSDGNPICKRVNNLPVDLYAWITKIVGLFISGAAAAQGAPFWFDILRKFVNVRGSGINPNEKK